jgi:hypothetical protein
MPVSKKKKKKKNQVSTNPSIIQYVMKGPHAIELRLAQLEKEIEMVREHLTELACLSLKLKKSRWLSSATASALRLPRLVPKTAATISFVGKRTLHELQAEKDALVAFIGKTLRTWEVKPTGPAPAI